MTTTIPESSTNKDLNLKNSLFFNKFINSSEFGYKNINDDDILGDETMSYMSGSYNRSNNCDSDNIDIFILDKMSFKRARIFAKNEEIYYDTFCENKEFKVDSIFSIKLESTLTLLYNESIILENLNSSNTHLLSCEIDKDTFKKAKSNNQLHSLEPVNPFLLKTIFKIRHVDFSTHSDECFEFTSEDSEKIDEQLGNTI
ncbi:13847_t:CDS:2 [Cetraspora pellucida]|uniref:13847_t:CDS:1 n=1 Tax=Cetraspora pellucida TaxID=1433469 RepID=A0A9N8ZXC1_9GLOM|nr:13847_t:CDS:2 [Cetraspora pellucida]